MTEVMSTGKQILKCYHIIKQFQTTAKIINLT